LTSEPIEPLVIEREFHGAAAGYAELSEEFRLFHNLYEDGATGDLHRFDEAGNDAVVAHVRSELVVVQAPLIRQYQAARQMDLLLFIDTVLYLPESAMIPPEAQFVDADQHVARYSRNADGRRFTSLLGKRVIPAPPIEMAGIWPYEAADTHFPEFIIRMDDFGKPVRFTCDPEQLANHFGKNPGAPHYLTPVFFRRDVLVKYFDRPDLYAIEDGHLRCQGLWILRMDNDASDVVVVFLGDLGRDLPASERDYWLSFNIPPTGPMSQTAFRRAFRGEFANPQSLDLRLRSAWRRLEKDWTARFGWPLYRALQSADAHLPDQIRMPLHDTDAEFEELVGTLAKLLVESLNEAELVAVAGPGPVGERGISKLERWFKVQGYPTAEADIAFLRNLQAVRSKVVAHRKGSDYERAIDRAVGSKRKAAAAIELLAQALAFVDNLLAFTSGGGNDDNA
jgi:hypothetical protein